MDDSVMVEYCGTWLPATVLWRHVELSGRPRVLVRFQTAAGFVVRQLRWADELLPAAGRVLELELRELGPGET